MRHVRERELNLNLRITAEERATLKALADHLDLSASTCVRHMLREAYAARFDESPGRPSTLEKK